ncbi:MAG: YbaK/EbsC family protein [Anaerolineae bacterium]|nr:YbaK/EbsC family protein [Anaerolineae bacterium]
MYQIVLNRLNKSGANYAVHTHADSRTFADAVDKLPFPPDRMLKTIAFRLKAGGWVLAACRGQDALDYKKLAAAFGVKRDEIVRPTPEELLAGLGLEVGAVSPIALRPDVQVVFDTRVDPIQTLFTGAGQPDRTLEITLSELVRVTAGRIVDIAKET